MGWTAHRGWRALGLRRRGRRGLGGGSLSPPSLEGGERPRGRWGAGPGPGSCPLKKTQIFPSRFNRGLSDNKKRRTRVRARCVPLPFPLGVCACGRWGGGVEACALTFSLLPLLSPGARACFSTPALSSSAHIKGAFPLPSLPFPFACTHPLPPPRLSGNEDPSPGPCFASSPLKTGPDAENRLQSAGTAPARSPSFFLFFLSVRACACVPCLSFRLLLVCACVSLSTPSLARLCCLSAVAPSFPR